jgi:hypothetical protein
MVRASVCESRKSDIKKISDYKVNSENILLYDWILAKNIISEANPWKEHKGHSNWFFDLAADTLEQESRKFQKYIKSWVFARVRRKVTNYHDAEDCVNNILLDTYNAIDKYNPSQGKRLKYWVDFVIGRRLNSFLKNFYKKSNLLIELIGLDYSQIESKHTDRDRLKRKSSFYRKLDPVFYKDCKRYIMLLNVMQRNELYNIYGGIIDFYEPDILESLKPVQRSMWRYSKRGLRQREIAAKLNCSLGFISKNIQEIRKVAFRVIG